MNEPTLWIICGPPGTGKSTFLENFFTNKTNTAIISRDKIRCNILNKHPNSKYFDKERKVFKEFIRQIEYAFTKNDNVIADATHINEWSRNKLLNALGRRVLDGKRINVIYMNVLLEIALERNSKREGLSLVPEEAIKRMFENYSFPTYNEEYYYDNIFSVDERGAMIRKERE